MARSRPLPALLGGLAPTLLLVAGCAPSTSASQGVQPSAMGDAWQPPVQVSHPPFDQGFHANWLETLGIAYAYIEVTGDYRRTGSSIPMLLDEVRRQGLRVSPTSSPFCLFYDDPGKTPIDQLRSRVCVEISRQEAVRAPLGVDNLQGRTAVHACVSGPYSEATRAYPLLFKYMRSMNWERYGPVREIYHVAPDAVDGDYRQLVCEVVIPVRRAR